MLWSLARQVFKGQPKEPGPKPTTIFETLKVKPKPLIPDAYVPVFNAKLSARLWSNIGLILRKLPGPKRQMAQKAF